MKTHKMIFVSYDDSLEYSKEYVELIRKIFSREQPQDIIVIDDDTIISKIVICAAEHLNIKYSLIKKDSKQYIVSSSSPKKVFIIHSDITNNSKVQSLITTLKKEKISYTTHSIHNTQNFEKEGVLIRSTEWEDKIDKVKLITALRNFDWSRGIPGGWLKYTPPRMVIGYGDGSLYTDDGEKYGEKWSETSWSGSVPKSSTTAVSSTEEIPKSLIDTNILKVIRDYLRKFGVDVDDSSCTGIWANYYTQPEDSISEHQDNEDYYAKNYKNSDPIFVSLNLYEDEDYNENSLSRFQIKKDNKWVDVGLPHMSLFIMSGNIFHRVMKPAKNNFRKRYNLTFRTPVKRVDDVVKNYRFFSNFGRYYRQTDLLYVPANIFEEKVDKNNKFVYDSEKRVAKLKNKEYALVNLTETMQKVLETYSQKYEGKKEKNLHLQINDSSLNREELYTKIKEKGYKFSKAPLTTTTQGLLNLYTQLKDDGLAQYLSENSPKNNPSTYSLRKLTKTEFTEKDYQKILELKEQATVTKIMGNLVPREQILFSRSGKQYKFGGAPPTKPYFPECISKLATTIGYKDADIAVINFYRENTKDSISFHTDAEPLINPTKVGSVSFGQTIDFSIRTIKKENGRFKYYNIKLGDRDVFEMLGSFQEYFQHSVPKPLQPREKMRINVTFRYLK